MLANNDRNAQDTVSPTTRRAVKNAKRHGLQSPTVDVINEHTAEVTQVRSGYTPDPRREEWRELNRAMGLASRNAEITHPPKPFFDIAGHVATSALECAICHETIEAGESVLYGGITKTRVHGSEHLCNPDPKVPSPLASASLTVTNGTASANQIEAVKRMQVAIHEAVTTVAKLDTTCVVCGGPIARGHGALFAPNGLIHARPDVCERNVANDHHAAKYDDKTTPEFMAVLDSISTASPLDKWVSDETPCHLFAVDNVLPKGTNKWVYMGAHDSFLAAWHEASTLATTRYRITRYGDVYDQPQPAPSTEPDDTAPAVTKTIIAKGETVDGEIVVTHLPTVAAQDEDAPKNAYVLRKPKWNIKQAAAWFVPAETRIKTLKVKGKLATTRETLVYGKPAKVTISGARNYYTHMININLTVFCNLTGISTAEALDDLLESYEHPKKIIVQNFISKKNPLSSQKIYKRVYPVRYLQLNEDKTLEFLLSTVEGWVAKIAPSFKSECANIAKRALGDDGSKRRIA